MLSTGANDHGEYCCHGAPVLHRRRLLGLLGSGAATLLAGTSLPFGTSFAAGTDALLLNCIDYRLTDATTRYMAPESRYVNPSSSATARATVDLPAPAGPSIATTVIR